MIEPKPCTARSADADEPRYGKLPRLAWTCLTQVTQARWKVVLKHLLQLQHPESSLINAIAARKHHTECTTLAGVPESGEHACVGSIPTL